MPEPPLSSTAIISAAAEVKCARGWVGGGRQGGVGSGKEGERVG